MRDRQICIGCGKKSPETETNYTLISAQFGWRLTRYRGADGSIMIEWRCPQCWRDFKRSKGEPLSGSERDGPRAGAGTTPLPPPPHGRAHAASDPEIPSAPRVSPNAAPTSVPPPKTGRTPR